ARARESPHGTEEIRDQPGPVAANEAKAALHVEAVDHHAGSAGWLLGRPALEDSTVVVDRGLGSKSANEADDRHASIRRTEGRRLPELPSRRTFFHARRQSPRATSQPARRR